MVLHTNKLIGILARRQPLLSTINKTKHLEFAKPHWNSDWKSVIWSDETKIERLATDIINMFGGRFDFG